MHGEGIFWRQKDTLKHWIIYVNMNGIHHFFNHKTSLELDSIQVFFQCLGQIIEHFKKYSHKLVQYYELYLVKQG